jgi:hypothetical protein
MFFAMYLSILNIRVMRGFSFIVFILLSVPLFAQQDGLLLDHDVYDDWKDLKNAKISNDGLWVTYEINPQKGDGCLHIYNTVNARHDSVERGCNARFMPSSKYLVFKIKPQSDSVRQCKLKKVKKDKMPKDSLGVWDLESGKIDKFPRVKSWKMPEKEGGWFAFLNEVAIVPKDTSNANDSIKPVSKKKAKKKPIKNEKLFVFNPKEQVGFTYDFVTDYDISDNGLGIGIVSAKGDSIDSTFVYYFNASIEDTVGILSKPGTASKIKLNKQGDMVSFIFSEDTAKIKIYDLFLWSAGKEAPEKLFEQGIEEIPSAWSVSPNGDIYFSESDERLYFGVAPNPEPKPKDTLTKDEKVSLDVWNWKDPLLQPHQLKNVESEKKRSFLSKIDLNKSKFVLLGDTIIRNVSHHPKGPGKYALGYTRLPYQKQMSWDAAGYKDVYLIDQSNGDKKKILEGVQSSAVLSPAEKFVLWFNVADSAWYAYDIKGDKNRCLSCLIEANFYNEEFDMLFQPPPYGYGGWTNQDKYVLIYDALDIWKVDPKGKEAPVNLSQLGATFSS